MKNQINEKIVAFYCQSAVENDESIEEQKKKHLDYANKNSIKNYRFYIDNGFSSKTLDRPDLNRLITDSKEAKISCVVVTEIGKISRDFTQAESVIKQLMDYGVDSITSAYGEDYSDISNHTLKGVFNSQPIYTEVEYEHCGCCGQLL